MNRILSFFLICYILLQCIGVGMANQMSARPLPLPIGDKGLQPVPIPHPADGSPIRPLAPAKIRIHSEIGLLLIEDDVTSKKYVTTLDSRGNRMAGSTTQTIFGFPYPTAQLKPITWYTHDNGIDIKSISDLVPSEAFAGVTDMHGAALLQVNGGIDIQPSGLVNPVFSPKAWDEFSKMSVGGSHTISVTELLTNGSQRRLDTLVTKRGQLRLSQARPDCKPEIVDGVDGQVCTLRAINGQHQAISVGDIRFTVSAKASQAASRFRIANKWHHMNEPVTLAEFSNGHTLDVFFPSRTVKEDSATIRLAERFDAHFFSLSRQAMGDRLSIEMERHNEIGLQHPVLARADLLLIEDIPTARQYVTTLGSSSSQIVFGELHHPQGVKWYTTFQEGITGLNPLVRVSKLQPTNYFQGVANINGQVSPSIVRPPYEKGFIYPVFSDDAFNALNAASTGRQQRLALMGEYDTGSNVPFILNVNKKGHIKLSMPSDNRCSAADVEGSKGIICPLRDVSGIGTYFPTGDIYFNLNAKLPYSLQQSARYRVSNKWLRLGMNIALSDFNTHTNSRIEVFIPDDQNGDSPHIYAIEGSFISKKRGGKDSFTVGFTTRQSPAVVKTQKVNTIYIEDKGSGDEYVSSVLQNDTVLLTGSKRTNNLRHSAKLMFKYPLHADTVSVTPHNWVYNGINSTNHFNEVKLTSEGFTSIKNGKTDMLIDMTLSDGRKLKNIINFNNMGVISFNPKESPVCDESSVDNDSGVICKLASVNGSLSGLTSTGKDIIRVVVPDGQQLRIASGAWHKNNDIIGYNELSSGFVEVFIPHKFSLANVTQGLEYRLDFKSAFNDSFSIKLIKSVPSFDNKLAYQCSGSTNYAPHFASNEGYYKGPETLDLSSLSIGQEKLIHHFTLPSSSDFLFVESRDGRTFACENDPHRINETKPFPANQDGTIPSGNNDFVFALYKKSGNRFINAHGGVLETSPGGFQSWYLGGGYELRVKRIANTGDQSKMKYPQIIPDLVPTDTGGRVYVYEAQDGPGPLEQRGFWTDSDGVWPFPPVPAVVDYVMADPIELAGGETTRITVHLDRKALANQPVYVKFDGKGSADISDLIRSDMQNLVGATQPVTDLAAGGVVLVNENQEFFTFELPIKNDADTGIETFDIRAKAGSSDDPSAKFVTVTIKPALSPVHVIGVEAVPYQVDAGGKTHISIELDKEAQGTEPIYVKLFNVDTQNADIATPYINASSVLTGATGSIADLFNGGYVTANANTRKIEFDIVTADDLDIAQEAFAVAAKEESMPSMGGSASTLVVISPKKQTPAIVSNITAVPFQVDAGNKTHISIELDKGAIGSESIYVKLFNISTQNDDIATPYIKPDSALTGATGNVVNLFSGGYVTPITNAKVIEFDLTTNEDSDQNKEWFSIAAKEGSMPSGDASSENAVITILPKKLSPEISFTNHEPPKSGVFYIGAPDIPFSYGVRLTNYVPSKKSQINEVLQDRLFRALSIKVDVSGIKSYNPGGRYYCSFETDGGKLVPFPFFLQQESGTEMPIDCTALTSLPLSAPELWTGPHVDTTYNTTINARVVMGDNISQMASGMGWHGIAKLNGTLTLNMQVK